MRGSRSQKKGWVGWVDEELEVESREAKTL